MSVSFTIEEFAKNTKKPTGAFGIMSKKSIEMSKISQSSSQKKINFVGAGSFGNPWVFEEKLTKS